MLNSKPVLPWMFRFINKIADFLSLHKLSIASLEEKILCNEAINKTGLNNFGDLYYREALNKLIESAKNDADFHFIGRCIFHSSIVTFLSNRLLLTEVRKQTPKVFQTKLLPPIIIIGLPRTGTTYLHQMLSLDPNHRGVPLWELMRPIPFRTPDNRRKKALIESKFRAKIVPKVDRMHFSRGDTFEECIILLGTTLMSDVFWTTAPVYQYIEWLKLNFSLKAYEEYRSLLQILQSTKLNQRLVLKAPAHTAALDKLMQAIPEALVIQNHRHPIPVLHSFNSLICELHNMSTKKHDRMRIAQTNLQLWKDSLNTSMKWRAEHSNAIYDVHYNRLLTNPLGTIKDIYTHFQLDWSQKYEILLKSYIGDNPKGKHGKHQYNASDFGITNSEISDRFKDYVTEYGIKN